MNLKLCTSSGDRPMGKQRTAIVTGGASGIGRAVAEALALYGYAVVVADVDADQGQGVANAIGGQFVCADLSNRQQCRQVVDSTLAQFGSVDVLVNNAGFQHISPIESFPEEIWERMLSVMLTAPFLLIRYVWPYLKTQGWGRIINVSSIHGQVASPFKAGYISAKHGLIGLTRAAALEGGPYGITVNAICPAYVRTPLVENQIHAQAEARGISPEAVVEDVMLEPAAIKRLIEPQEIGSLVVYLCSDAAASITGAALNLDLGWTAR
ncbi:MAG: 3-hydroxybutyrate dehydrogenase [Caldilineaceae bacterium]|nr:3-hydroxybutyrate dehydrogenase [Caldilineaceae bacterium]